MTSEFTPHSDKQEQAIFSDAKITACITGIQWGKSTVGAVWLKRQIHMSPSPESAFLVCAPTYKILDQATTPAFLAVMEGMGVYREQKAIFELYGGSKVYFRTGTDPDSVVGITNVKAVWGDEAGKYSLYFWDNIQARASFKDAPIMLTTSPYSLNWIYRDLIRKRPAHAVIIGAESRDNPYFPITEWNRRKETMDPRRFAAIYGGRFEKMQGLVYDAFDDDTCQIDAAPLPDGTQFWGGIDWGFTDPCVIQIRARTPSGHQYQISETYERGLTVSDVVAIAKQKYNAWGVRCFFCDPSQPAHIQELNRNGIPAVAAENAIRIGVDVHYELIKSGKFRIFRGSSPHSIDEYSTYHYPEPKDLAADDKAKEQLPVSQDDHAMDCARYLSVMLHRQSGGKLTLPGANTGQEEHFARLARLKRKSQDKQSERWG